MPDDSQGAGAPQDTEQQSAEGQQPGAGATETQTQTQQETPKPQQDSANKLIKDFVSKRGITVEDLLTQITEREDAEKTEIERLSGERDSLKSELDTLRQQMRDNAAESAFLDAATKANARAPRTLFRAYKSDLAFDDDGAVTNLDAVIAKAQEDEPDLFRSSTGRADNGQKGETPTSDMDMNDVLRGMANQAPR